MLQAARQMLQDVYGYPKFRTGQENMIETILSGRDALGIMPTGGGKSICYQIPALLLPGTTIVISPLISLMKDQVDALATLGISAAYINSSLTGSETMQRLRSAANGEYKLLYVAPERLETDSFRSLLEVMPVPLLAIDEAHCVSQWGHDFRTSYTAIAPLLRQFPKRPVVAAFTATATEEVKKDMVRLLELRDPGVTITGFDRENLTLSVLRGVNKRDYVVQYVRDHPEEAGIIYASTRKDVDELSAFLQKQGVAAGKYHAGLTDDERQQCQDGFLRDDIRVMVATNAFGMGIDKSNVRYVLHYNMPKNMEAYYQEAGRAGRDGEPGTCVLLFSPQDIQTQKFLIEQSVSSPERKTADYKKLQAMADYCHTQQCLRSAILRYFGELDADSHCGNCSSCNDDSELVDVTVEAQKVFSCIKRMSERFGATLVSQVLKGSRNKRIAEFGFERLPTYGVMSNYTEKAISDLIHSFVAEGYLALSEGQYPVVSLQQPAGAVLRGQAQVMRKLPKRKQVVSGGDELFDKLRRLRKQLADAEGVPPYIIFADSTLRDMALTMPTDERSMLEVKGVGLAKFKRYGQPFLELLVQEAGETEAGSGGSAYVAEAAPAGEQAAPSAGAGASGFAAPESGRREPQRSLGASFAERPTARSSASPSPLADKQASHLVSWQMFAEGLSPEDVAKERGMGLITVQDHIIRCALEGCEVDWSELIPANQEPIILEAVERIGADKLRPIKDALPPEIDYFAIKAVIAKQRIAAGDN
ncbi:DNA helicase RecQ [Paenibacillus contaminans]|uniref:DNA helicase RecQ n=2 Tax=Paenibacillus contaminans TaxID=450362 RepID=A0A329M5M0_9BACL|nr:DNA helicase RecQ [Paenibacillus contaminans]